MDQKEKERQPNTPEPQHTTVEHTTPLWRVLAVALIAGSIAAIGFYLERVGHADDFATVLVVTAAYSIGFWARKRPDRLRGRFGPFGKVADAIRESLDDIREYVFAKPLRVGVAIAAGYGVALVVAKTIVVAVLGGLYSWELAVAFGAAVGAVAAAPGLFRSLGSKLSGPPEPPEEEDPDEDRDGSEDASDGPENQGRDDD